MSEQTPNPEPTNDSPIRTNWAKLHLWQMQPVRDVLLALGLILIFIIGQKISVVTVPLILAIMLAYLFEPVIVWAMRKFRVSRRSCVIGIIASVVLLIIIPAIVATSFGVAQLAMFTSKSAHSITSVSEALNPDGDPELARQTLTNETSGPWVWIYDQILLSQAQSDESSLIGDAMGSAIEWIDENQTQVATTATGVGVGMLKRGLSFIGAVFGLGFLGFLTAFFFFFVSTEWIQFKQFSAGLLPDKNRDRIIDLLQKFDAVISGFIRGRITIAFIQAIVFSIGFFAIGVPGAFLLGPLVAILSIVPYLALVGVPIAVSLLWLQGYDDFRGIWWWAVGAPVVLYFLGQALDDYVWTPLIQGKSTGMDTPTILFASLAGGALFGVFGLLIAIPLAACAKILIQEIFWPRFKEWAEGRAADPLPIED